MRRLEVFKSLGKNPLWHLYRSISIIKVAKNFLIIEAGRFCPFTQLKHKLYKNGLGMKLGAYVSFAYKAMPDLMYPERIYIGNNSVVGYNTVILTHEYLVDEYRIGNVFIGENTMIGANVTILPGVRIGNDVQIGAGSVVAKDIPDRAVCYGNPLVMRSK